MDHFGNTTARMQSFREELLNTEPRVCAERAVLITESYRENSAEPMVIRRARAYAHILENMTIFIEPQTLIAGNQASSNRAAPIFPEYAMDWVIDELDQYDKRDGDRFLIDEETKEQLRSIAPFWQGNTVKDRGLAAMPASSRLLYDLGVIKAEGNITSGDAHLAVNYRRLLEEGLAAYRERTERAMDALDLTDCNNLAKHYFYRAVLIVIDATVAFAARYAVLAENLAKTEADEERAAQLREMARILRRVPNEKAETFHEAIQAVWLIQLCLQIESNGHSLSYGRVDQFFYPYYKRDIEAGRLTADGATELIVNLCLKTYSINKIRSWSHTRFSAGSPLYQNMTIGGQTTDEKDAVNELSYLFLKAVAQNRLPQPNLTVRYHNGLSDDFMRECIELVRYGIGMPSFNSDEIIIKSFMDKGVSHDDAYDYSAIGCVEVAVPGKWGYRCTGMSFLNFPKSLLIALNRGIEPDSGKRVCKDVGCFTEMSDFSEVLDAWDHTIRELARQSVIIDSSCDLTLEKEAADILCSALTDDCIGRGLTLKEGGAVYDFISDLQVGIANLADSLAAIKKCVFEDRSMTAAELWDACMNNFAGEKGADIRLKLLAAPKYGNDDDYVDSLLVRAYNTYIDEIFKHHNTRFGRGPIGGGYYAGTSSISANVPQGAGTGATPDGRYAGEPLAEGCSPSHGSDKKGPTAVFKSISKLPTDKITGGVLLNQKLTPQMLEKVENREKLIMLLRAFFGRLHGFHVQFNVVSRDTLLDAQKNPEKHRDLIVRVAGYSAFFNVLSRQTQDDIIERTEQTL